MLLSDVAMESDDFATALDEADAGLKYLERTVAVRAGGWAASEAGDHPANAAVLTHPTPTPQADDRRLAEAHYKRCMALQVRWWHRRAAAAPLLLHASWMTRPGPSPHSSGVAVWWPPC